MLYDRRGTQVDDSDQFRFTPPDWWDTEGDAEQREAVAGIRGRIVSIRETVTTGRHATVRLSSADPLMRDWLRSIIGNKVYPVEWLTLID